MTVWEPWDADVDELSGLRVIRAQIPQEVRPAIVDWVFERLDVRGWTPAAAVNALQSALRLNWSFERGDIDSDQLLAVIQNEGDKVLLRVVDYLLSQYEPLKPWNSAPSQVAVLSWHLDTTMSAVRVAVANDTYRLARRLPEGIEDAAQLAVDASSQLAGQYLAAAIRQTQSLEPNTSLAMTEAIKAVEAAAGPVVIPKDRQYRLGKIVQALKDKADWALILDRRDDDVPDHRMVLIGMLETLAFAQQNRHVGDDPSVQQATAHAMLAATLVGWFATGAVVMEPS